MTFTATIRGLPHNPAITEINTRSGPSTDHDKPLKARVGLANLPILDVQPDENDTRFNDKVYQWFQLEFPDGQRAWVRDDLLSVIGDGVRFGYDVLDEETFAFVLTRHEVIPPGAEVMAAPTPSPAPTPVAPAPPPAPPTPLAPAPVAPEPAPPVDDPLLSEDRIRAAAFNITHAFEGGGYASYQNYDDGIVSYGRFQFTLAGSGLYTVLEKYCNQTSSPVANELRSKYLQRTRNHDPELRHDHRFRELIISAADDPAMQLAQDSTATELYWDVVQDLSLKPRGIETALGKALVFDMAINFGPRHGFLGAAERELGVAPKSRLIINGAREEELMAALAKLRKQSHDRQAERDNLPGLKLRGDFWVNLVAKGDWQLMGDDDGHIEVTPGKRVQVRGF
jgi:hypothetical protein